MSLPRYGVNVNIQFVIISDSTGKCVVMTYEAPANLLPSREEVNARLQDVLKIARFELKADDVRLARPDDFEERGPQWLV